MKHPFESFRGARTGREYVCDDCRRVQLAFSESVPNGLTEREARMIGWANTSRGTGWLCPFHAPGGKGKLEDVVRAGHGELKGDK